MTFVKLAFAAALLVLAPLSAQAACPQNTAALAKVDAARKAMLALPIGDGTETDVSPAARTAIAAMKDALAAFVTGTLQCTNADAPDAAILKSLSPGSHPPDPSNRDPNGDNYGYSVSFAVRHDKPDLLAVTATFQIECGEDALLLIFERNGAGWHPAMRLQSTPYSTVAGGWGTFDYALSPRDAAGKWFAAVKSISPWCSSTWSEIHYGAFRPTDDAQKPKQILAGSDSIWFGGDDEGRLSVASNIFDLRFHADSIDSGVHNREWIRRYAVNGDSVQRVAPLADSARDFADEWIKLDWAQAKPWTDAAAAPRLQTQHDAAHKIGSFNYDTVRKCSGGTTQIEVDEGDSDKPSPHTFFLVSGDRDFRMMNVSAKPNPHCGANLYRAPE